MNILEEYERVKKMSREQKNLERQKLNSQIEVAMHTIVDMIGMMVVIDKIEIGHSGAVKALVESYIKVLEEIT